MFLAWRALLADLGSPLPPLPAAIRVMFIGQLGKYVPQSPWALAAQVELARDYDVPRGRSATASLVGMATTLVVALIAAGVMLPLTSAHAAGHYWWVLAIAPLAVVCLHPKIIESGLNLVLRTPFARIATDLRLIDHYKFITRRPDNRRIYPRA